VNVTYEDKIRLLKKQGAESIEHSGRTLLDHLVGTHNLLKQWHRREPVCDAGLFHSVYGTEHFPKTTMAASLRLLVKSLIGEDAERLVWIFGALERESFDRNIPRRDGYFVTDRTNGQKISLSSTEWLDLVDITFANTLEAMPHISWLQRKRCRKYLEQFGLVASPAARELLSKL